MNDEDDRFSLLDERLRALPPHAAADEVALRVRRRALSELARQRAHLGRPWMGMLVIVWSRIVMPVALASVVGVYLVWAFRFAGSLYR